MNKTTVYKIGKHKNATRAGGGVQRDTSPTLLLCGGETEDTTHDLLEEVSFQMCMSPIAPFRFMQSSRQITLHTFPITSG